MDALSLAVPERSSTSLFERTAARKRAQEGTAQTARKIRLALDEVRRKYQYRRLSPDHTRLLVIHPPRNGPDEIYVELLDVAFEDLGEKVHYEALSYHWGGETELKPIYVLTERESKREVHVDWEDSPAAAKHRSLQMIAKDVLLRKLHIKANLYSALRNLRLNTRRVVLWVDALCIDQSDSAELGLQVSKMVEIYSRASRVIVWLGDEDQRSRNAIEFIQDITDADDIEDILSDQSSLQSWGDLVHLMQNPWFSRRWVIQEMVHARKAVIQLSDLSISWTRFKDAASLFGLNAAKVRALLSPLLELSMGLGHGVLLHNNLGSLDFLLQNNLNGLPAKVFVDILDYMFRPPKSPETGGRPIPIHGLEYLVSTLFLYDNSDPRDTVFALRNIAADGNPTRAVNDNHRYPPEPDYTKTLMEVYSEFVSWVIESTGIIDILCRPWASKEQLLPRFRPRTHLKFPSWIRVATERDKSRRGMESVSFVGLPGQQIYNACLGMSARANVKENIADLLNGYVPHSESLVGKRIDSDTFTSESSTDLNPIDAKMSDTNHREGEDITVSPILRHHARPSDERMVHLDSPETNLKSLDLRSANRFQKMHELHVDGLAVGTIAWATDPIEDGVVPHQALDKLRTLISNNARRKLCHTLVAERGPDGRNPPTWYERAARYCMKSKTTNGHLNIERLLSQPQPTIVRAFLERVQAVISDRCFIEVMDDHTNELFVGFSPAETQESDALCVLFGCSVPCVLRRVETSQDGYHYKFIGEAYIYGLMDGEAISKLSWEELEKRTTTFRLL